MNIFGIGLPEMMLIFVVALLIFGPKKLPEIGRSLGKTLRSFQDATNEFKSEFQQEMTELENTVKMQAQLEPETTSTAPQETTEASATEPEKPTTAS